MLERNTTNIGCENEAETQFRVIVRNFRKVESHFVVVVVVVVVVVFEKKGTALGKAN